MGRRDYDIAFVGLKQGIHEYHYQVNDKFFEAYQEQDFCNCRANIKLTLDKQTGFMLLKFEIGGVLEVTCDRCGSTVLPMNLWDEFNVVVKLAEEPDSMNEQEEDPDVYYIGRGESHLHIANWIYEFINLSIPMQRMCSEEKIGSQHCNNDVLDLLKKGENEPNGSDNPIWKDLEKLKKNLDN
ncbi:MAG: hypothetical protein NVSMB7_15460 [Chitinophagaceae bacterium]